MNYTPPYRGAGGGESDQVYCSVKTCNKSVLKKCKNICGKVCTNCGLIYSEAYSSDTKYNWGMLQGNSSYMRKSLQQEIVADEGINHYLKSDFSTDGVSGVDNKRMKKSLEKCKRISNNNSMSKEEKKKRQILVLVDEIINNIPEFKKGYPKLGSIKNAAIKILGTILQVWQKEKQYTSDRKKKFSLPKHHIVIACCVSIIAIKTFQVGILQETVVQTSINIDPQCTNSKVSRFLKMLEALPEVFDYYCSNKEIYENITTFFCNKYYFIPFRVGQEAKRLSDEAIYNVLFAGRSPKIAISAAIHHLLYDCPKLDDFCKRSKEENSVNIRNELKESNFILTICDKFEIKEKTLLLSSEEIASTHLLCCPPPPHP